MLEVFLEPLQHGFRHRPQTEAIIVGVIGEVINSRSGKVPGYREKI